MNILDVTKSAAIVVGVGVAVWFVWKAKGSIEALVAAAPTKLNPASPDNVVNSGIVAPVVSAATGGRTSSLGTALYGFFNPEDAKRLCAAGISEHCR